MSTIKKHHSANAGDEQEKRPTRLIDKREVCARLSISVSTLYDRIVAGDLERPVKIGVASRWPEASIDDYISRKLQERDALQKITKSVP